MRDLDPVALDRYITGAYGEDFFRDDDDQDEVEYDGPDPDDQRDDLIDREADRYEHWMLGDYD